MDDHGATPPQFPEPKAKALSRRGAVALVGGAAGVAALSRLGRDQGVRLTPTPSQDFSARFAEFQPADEPNGDLAMVSWPAFVAEAGGDVPGLYAFQVLNGDLMRWMPCFCGCHLEDGHRNNRDCYVEAVNPDGSVIFDRMAPT
jgi:hypothetical protein